MKKTFFVVQLFDFTIKKKNIGTEKRKPGRNGRKKQDRKEERKEGSMRTGNRK